MTNPPEATVVKKPSRIYKCGICLAPLRDQEWVYSPHSGERYCEVSEWEACSERAFKRSGK